MVASGTLFITGAQLSYFSGPKACGSPALINILCL